MEHRCLICADQVAEGELLQHLTGDYHRACFASIAAAGVTIERWKPSGGGGSSDGARCLLCRDGIAPFAIVVRPGGFVVHLKCFFNPPRASRASLGAAAWRQTVREQSLGLCRRSEILRRESGRVRAQAWLLRDRHRAVISSRERAR